MDMFRSESMSYVQVTMPTDAAQLTISALGDFGKLHVMDLSDGENTSKQFMVYKKRAVQCAFWLKKLEYFKKMLGEYGVPEPQNSSWDIQQDSLESADVLHEIEEYLEPLENEIVQSLVVKKANENQIYQSLQASHVLRICQDLEFAGEADDITVFEGKLNQSAAQRRARNSLENPLLIELQATPPQGGSLKSTLISGVIDTAKHGVFQRMVYRVTRGNTYVRFVQIAGDITNPETGETKSKSVFYTVCIGEVLAARVRRICTMLDADVYTVPTDAHEFAQRLQYLNQEMVDKGELGQKTKSHVMDVLRKIAEGDADLSREKKVVKRSLTSWIEAISRERDTCAAFMKCHFYLTMICLEGWCIESALPELRDTLDAAVAGRGLNPAMLEIDPVNPVYVDEDGGLSPPTHFETNTFTGIFQSIVDTYGVPRYKEANPGLFTIVTFPFLFGVMYGDIGHGIALFLMSLYVVLREKHFLEQQARGEMGEMFGMVFQGRYCLLMMGFFAIYCGFIYNDCMSNPVNLFPTHWSYSEHHQTFVTDGGVYPFGIDPSWYHKTNELIFFNGFKMKISIILGVIQMTFGILLSFSNQWYHGDCVSILLDFIPRLLFMSITFGYMCFLIVFKWCVDWYGAVDPHQRGSPPNLIQTMINMCLSPMTVDPDMQLYEGQAAVQFTFLMTALVLVPLMFFGKPTVLWLRSQNSHYEGENYGVESHSMLDDQDEDTYLDDLEGVEGKLEDTAPHKPAHSGGGGHGAHGEFSFGGEMIHQGIHTIEFVLGCVSNTASYLRLWALSLAHSQLAQVFWDMAMMQYGISTRSPIFVVIGFGAWFGATVGVLLGMDVLECFLHALRLHWVEFQNKFFYADGYKFEAFTFKTDKTVSE